MTDQPTAEARCAACGARWSRMGDRWLVTDIHGRLTMAENGGAPLLRCPVCKALVAPAGAKVAEERG